MITETMTTVDFPPEAVQLASEAEEMAGRYSAIQIRDQVGFDSAGELLKEIKLKAGQIDDLQKSITRPLNEALKKIREHFKRPLEFLTQAESAVRRARLSFQQEQEKKRIEEERRLQELARKEEEKRRKQLEARAQKAEEKGKTDKAEELREQAAEVFVPAPVLESQVEKTAGIGMRKVWKYRIADLSLIPREYMVPNDKLLGQVARTMKNMAKVPGIQFYAEDVEVVSA